MHYTKINIARPDGNVINNVKLIDEKRDNNELGE